MTVHDRNVQQTAKKAYEEPTLVEREDLLQVTEGTPPPVVPVGGVSDVLPPQP